MLTVKCIAEDLGIDVMTVKRWIKSGKLPAEKESNRKGYRICVEDYIRFLDGHPKYRPSNEDQALWLVRRKVCKELLIGLHDIQRHFLLLEHTDEYSEGWNNAMIAFDKLIKETLVDKC